MEYTLGDDEPATSAAYVFPSATVIGDVTLAEEVSVWPGASIRADANRIRVGKGSNVQDNAVLHVSENHSTEIGSGVTIGHNATVHGCNVADNVLVGMGATVLSGVEIGEDCIVAAGALVPEGTEIPDGSVVMGVPGKVVRDVSDEEQDYIRDNAEGYRERAERYRDELARNSK